MTEWQDIVFSIGSLVFIVALLPSIFSEEKPSLITCIATMCVLYGFSFTYVTMDYDYAAVTTGITAMLWNVLAAQQAERLGDYG